MRDPSTLRAVIESIELAEASFARDEFSEGLRVTHAHQSSEALWQFSQQTELWHSPGG